MNLKLALFAGVGPLLFACSEAPQTVTTQTVVTSLEAPGRWIVEADGQIMVDPQTSGLTHVNGLLATISDGSAKAEQQRRIHLIDPASATLVPRPSAMSMSSSVRRSCFSQYLAEEPDLEALVADPNDSSVFYTVTEDATRTGALSLKCQQKYENTGSTDYPTLLVRLKRQDNGDTMMTDVRPLRFALDYQVGDFPNDGIEGLAMAPDGTLYMGLEKDAEGKARIFAVTISDSFWGTEDFAEVAEPSLQLPPYHGGNHPINGMEFYTPAGSDRGFLLAAARNDNELWVIDASGEWPAKQILMHFTAPTEVTDGSCPATERMDNASIEGIAVIADTLWMINDPWKVNYLKNIQCASNTARYEAMAPLLYSVPIDAAWFAAP